MNKSVIGFSIFSLVVVAGAGFAYNFYSNRSVITSDQPQPAERQESKLPSAEEAELVGFTFIQDFIASAPPSADAQAQQRAYDVLSLGVKQLVSIETISRDLAEFIGVQDVPDQGASVEDLQMGENATATLIVGLNYSGGRVLKAIDMVVEDGVWKVDAIRPLEQYP
jgi:hypothetical protein